MLSTDELDLLDSILNQHKGKIEEYKGDSESNNELLNSIENSIILNPYPGLKYEVCLKVLNCRNDALILVIKVDYKTSVGRQPRYTSENQLLGLKKLDFDYGNILIRPETPGDKFSELFHKAETDFDYFPLFSFRYYFQSDNESLAKFFATERRIKLMEQQREAEIEIRNDILMIRYARIINADDFDSIFEFIKEI